MSDITILRPTQVIKVNYDGNTYRMDILADIPKNQLRDIYNAIDDPIKDSLVSNISDSELVRATRMFTSGMVIDNDTITMFNNDVNNRRIIRSLKVVGLLVSICVFCVASFLAGMSIYSFASAA